MPRVKILQNIACWIPKTINTHSKYDVSFAFPWQQWLQQRAPLFSYRYIAYLV